MSVYIYIYICIYIYIYVYIIYIYTFINFLCHLQKCQCIYVKNKTFISKRVIFRFLPNFQRLNKIMKIIKSINLEND